MTPDAIRPDVLARFRTPPGKPADPRLYLTLRLVERAASAHLTDEGTLIVVGQTGTEYPVCLEVVDRLCDLGWLGLYDVDEVRVTQQGAYWSERFGKLNRVRG